MQNVFIQTLLCKFGLLRLMKCLVLFSIHQDESAVLPEEHDHPLIVEAKKELLGTNYSKTVEQLRLQTFQFLIQEYKWLVCTQPTHSQLKLFMESKTNGYHNQLFTDS